jgi:membrane protein implicated in regulation of membrane protease activity
VKPRAVAVQAAASRISVHVVAGWLVWTLIAVALAVGEMFTPGLFFLGPVALAALAAAVTAALGGGVGLALIVFIAASVASLALIRPIARRHVRMPAISRTGTDALVGSKAVVIRRVDADGGRVRIGGEEWSARSFLEDQVLDEGARVEVVKIEGATALVVE